jgi:hypothetical protein
LFTNSLILRRARGQASDLWAELLASWSSCRKFLLLASSILILASRCSLLASRQTIGNLHQHLQLLINPIFGSQTSVLLFISEGYCRATFYFRVLLQGYFSFRRATSGLLFISEGCFSFSRVTSGLLFISEGYFRANFYLGLGFRV